MPITTILIIVGLVLGGIAVIESKGRSLAGWGVVALAAALLL